MFGLGLKITHFMSGDLAVIFGNKWVRAQREAESYGTYGSCYICPDILGLS